MPGFALSYSKIVEMRPKLRFKSACSCGIEKQGTYLYASLLLIVQPKKFLAAKLDIRYICIFLFELPKGRL